MSKYFLTLPQIGAHWLSESEGKKMDYTEATLATLSFDEAKREIVGHGCKEDWKEFLKDEGVHEEYSGEIILNWLGY